MASSGHGVCMKSVRHYVISHGFIKSHFWTNYFCATPRLGAALRCAAGVVLAWSSWNRPRVRNYYHGTVVDHQS